MCCSGWRSFPSTENNDVRARHRYRAAAGLSLHAVRWFVQRFLCKVEGTPVNSEQDARVKGLHRLLGVAQQQTNVPRIGYLTAYSLSAISTRTDAFRRGQREFGYVEGKNIVIEWRFAEGKLD
jgi:hypothetical protein